MGWAEVTQGVPDWRTDSSCALLLTRHCRSCQKRHAKSTGATTKAACTTADAMLQHLVACPVRKAVFRVGASATHTISISVPPSSHASSLSLIIVYPMHLCYSWICTRGNGPHQGHVTAVSPNNDSVMVPHATQLCGAMSASSNHPSSPANPWAVR